jgi:hypothetical protein
LYQLLLILAAAQAATIRGTFSYKQPKVHDVEVRPGMTARMEGVDREISRIHFIDPQTEAPKPAPVTAVFKNLTSGTQQVRLRPPSSFVSQFN